MPARYTLGIDIGGTTTSLAVVDAQNHVAREKRFPTNPEAGFEGVLRRIIEAAAPALERYPCAAIGVAVAAHVDLRTGILVTSPNLGFENVPLGAILQEEFSVPAVVENDVNAAAFGEYLATPMAREPLCAVFVGTGVGGGLIVDGDIFHGADGFAAEIGHVPVVAQAGERCGCGQRGCVEAYAGGPAIVRRASARCRGKATFDDVDAVVRAAEAGDRGSADVLEEAAAYLGVALAAAVNLLNPGTLVIGGGVARAWPALSERALERMKRSALPASLAHLAIRGALLGERAGVIGAAALARKSPASGPPGSRRTP
ncbi:MAG: ROK family protein [candidate division Zixibacteria bacterium]|nr:ROK family protein [candidate division Zixibacteria bacterium]